MSYRLWGLLRFKMIIRPSQVLMLVVTASCILVEGQRSCNPGNPCPSGEACHPHKAVCIKEPRTITDRPFVWLDETEDKCERNATDCELFGFEYVDSHPRGRGDTWCQTGNIVRCQPPPAPGTKNTPANQIKILTYNVWERDFFITNDGQRERTCRIPTWMIQNHPDIDVFGLQEVFMGGCFANQLDLRSLFCHYGWCHSTPVVDAPETGSNGGIFLVSKWPIMSQDMLVFDEARDDSPDVLAAKGVSYGKIRKSVDGAYRNYHVMTTHLQAGGKHDVRAAQAGEWAHWLRGKNLPKDEPVFFCGDLNTDWYTETRELNTILSNLDAIIPEAVGPMNVTSDPSINDCNDNGDPGWIDWVLYGRKHLQPVSATQQALYPTWPSKFPACWCELCITLDVEYVWPDDDSCDEHPRMIRHLSDHFPVLGSFTFK